MKLIWKIITRNAVLSCAVKASANLLRDESGQDLIEYALVAALIALGAVASMRALSGKISTVFTTVGTNLTGAI